MSYPLPYLYETNSRVVRVECAVLPELSGLVNTCDIDNVLDVMIDSELIQGRPVYHF